MACCFQGEDEGEGVVVVGERAGACSWRWARVTTTTLSHEGNNVVVVVVVVVSDARGRGS